MIKKSTINGVMAVLSILILIVPIAVSGYIAEQTAANILAVQGDYANGENLEIYNGNLNITEIMDTQGTYSTSLGGWDANNDTAFVGYESGLLGDSETYFGNYITYIGNGSYSISVDWNDIGVGNFDAVRYLIIPLNISCNDLADYDFGRITTNIIQDGTVYFTVGYQDNTDILLFDTQSIDNDTGIFIIDQNRKNIMAEITSTYVYLIFSAESTDFDETQTAFTFNIEVFELESGDNLFGSEYTDTAIWSIMVLGLDAFYLFVFVFSNPMIDIKFDTKKKSKKGKWRR